MLFPLGYCEYCLQQDVELGTEDVLLRHKAPVLNNRYVENRAGVQTRQA